MIDVVTDTTTVTKEINHSWFFIERPEKIWNHLTQPEPIGQWLMKNNFEAVPGREFQLMTSPVAQQSFDVLAYCKLLEIEKPKRLSYSWRSGFGDGKIELESLVEWTLHPRGNATELHLKQSGYREASISIYNEMNNWWIKRVEKMITLLNSQIR